jgi:chain length determinant protein tyrosine kinase EpsG
MSQALTSPRRVAVVHEWLASHAGSEKVLEQILQVYPEADLFAVVDFLDDGQRAFVQGRHARTSFIQRLPLARKRFRAYLPLMPLAVEQLDLSGYDLVISSHHAVAKGVITGPDQLHVCYIHSPMRYAWDLQHQYLREAGLGRSLKSAVTRVMLHYLRQWDARTAAGVDVFVANSAFIARRVRKVYRREAQVLHPPVDVARFALRLDKDDFYLAASRLVPYKQMPLIAEAFARMPDRRLVVIGDGPDLARLRAAAGPNVTVLGYQSDAVLVDHMQRARALVFAAEEDFGITPVEAQACGTPVIAYGRGGSLETVRGHGPQAQRTGLFFAEQSAEAIVAAVRAFEALPQPPTPEACRRHAEGFAPERFRDAFRTVVEAAWQAQPSATPERPWVEPPAVPARPRTPDPATPDPRLSDPVPDMKRDLPLPLADTALPQSLDTPVSASPAAAPPADAVAPSRAPAAPAEPAPEPAAESAAGPEGAAAAPGRQPLIGDIISGLRPLSPTEVEHILVVQKRTGMRFGEAAVALALVSQADVLWALSRQFRYPYLREPERAREAGIVMASDPYGAPAEAFRDLRSQVVAAQLSNGRRALAVLSPQAGDGRSFVAANLALAFSQMGERTVLVDANLRAPTLHTLLGVPARASLSSLLCGLPVARPFDCSDDMPDLHVLQAGTPPPNPLELLERPLFRRLMDELQQRFDRVIVDTPAAQGRADARVIAAACGQAVLVGRKHRTATEALARLQAGLRQAGVDVMGVIVNNR